MKFNSDQESVVINALYTAAGKYRECAKEMGAVQGMNPEAQKSIVAQFEKQAADCSELIEKLES